MTMPTSAAGQSSPKPNVPRPSVSVLEEISNRLNDMRLLAQECGSAFCPPGLAIGTSERVGSNWFSDTLREAIWQHNEPFRQQLHPSHPLLALNPGLLQLADLHDTTLHPYEHHWLVTFVASKYGTARQLIKETNLFFAVGNYLRLFADAPVIVLSRHPVGIASSFARADLFRRWRYGRRYSQIQATVTRSPFAKYGFAVYGNRTSDLQKLGRLIVLNTLLLADALGDRPFVHVAYETAVRDQRPALLSVSRLLLGDDSLAEPQQLDTSTGAGSCAADATFGTRQAKTELHANLSRDEADALCAEVRSILYRAEDALSTSTLRRARQLLDLDGNAYAIVGRRAARPQEPRRVQGRFAPPIVLRFVQGASGRLRWRNTLVTNSEFCDFLNDLRAEGLANVVGGTHLLFNESMPHARGGRIHFGEATGSYSVSPGHENHPVYWITWIGAAVFARSTGSRLPTRREMDGLIAHTGLDLYGMNADYRVGDVVSVAEANLGPDAIHQPIGNLQVWCADGPDTAALLGGPMARYLYGIAWDTPATLEEVRRVKSRHLTGTSLGIGIRLVRDEQQDAPLESAATVANRLQRGFVALAQRERSLPELQGLVVFADGLCLR